MLTIIFIPYNLGLSVEEYKIQLHQHIEELLQREVDENRLIVKKNKNGKITDIISVTKEKKK